MSAPTFSDIQSDIHHLKHLVDTFSDILIGLDREGIADGSRAEIDRLESLVWIGRDRVDQLAVDFEQRFAVDAATRKAETDIIKAAGRDYEEKLRTWNAVADAAEREPDNAALKSAEQIAEDAHDAARDDLFAFTPTTPAGFAEKATVLLRVWNRAEGTNDNRIVQLFRSMGGTNATAAN
jgi:hypothetical protein